MVPHDYLDPNITSGGRSTEAGVDPEMIATDPEPTATASYTVLNRQMGGITRCNPEYSLEHWLPDLVLTADWIADNEDRAGYRKDLSHVGGHFNDWILTELCTIVRQGLRL